MQTEERNLNPSQEENLRLLRDQLADFDVAMMTTIQPRDGSLHSRPMVMQKTPFNGTLWFFTNFSTGKVDEIRAGSQVNLAYAIPNQERYLSISGAAYVIRDRIRMETLWNEAYRVWFPKGLDEPDLVLLRIDVVEAEIWDPSAALVGDTIRLV